ncbi:lasso peptide biosynthesis PqqD family chaperone [Paenibacillus sp. ATY16]|uniref:lasso peptide biosynthesis PqqD family chaperone n=1 Tax=Paenibacillus sp. ATY16 TaxID=1759312 RepID=UPI0020109205|nr:lasso peptide biosynthesis PqqD family chaperone [Paenibacillus sp. ATY16]MCK9860367.1 lasso peptide biosynthesis PqqD family chaperone [Paenibacillus sp. ATY16]
MSKSSVLIHERIVQAEGFLVSDMGGEKVMMSIQSGKYFNLGHSGGEIWELLAAPTTLEEIVNRLCLEYEIEKEVCVNQVASFLKQLAEQGLIVNAGA